MTDPIVIGGYLVLSISDGKAVYETLLSNQVHPTSADVERRITKRLRDLRDEVDAIEEWWAKYEEQS